jgi:hypothetical protein
MEYKIQGLMDITDETMCLEEELAFPCLSQTGKRSILLSKSVFQKQISCQRAFHPMNNYIGKLYDYDDCKTK